MSSTIEDQHIAPKYFGMLTSGIITASIGAAGSAVLTTYGTHAPGTITPGWTAILATTCVIGAGLILTAWGLRIVMRKLTSIEQKVDAHGRHVEREHGGLHEDAVDIGEQLAELRALVADLRHKLQPEPEQAEQHQRHVPKQRKRHQRRADGDNVLPLPAEAIRAARRLASRVIRSEEQRVEDNREDKS